MPDRPRYPSPEVADVILCRDRDKGSRRNIAAQRLVRWRKVHYSHVALHLEGCVLHAVPRTGVDVQDRVSFFIDPDLAPGWRVFRHRTVDAHAAIRENDENSMAWLINAEKIAGFYLKQAYNWKFAVSKQRFWRRAQAPVDSASFCSELVAKIFTRLELTTGFEHAPATHVFPTDIAHAVETSGHWVEVTGIYQEWLDGLTKSPDGIEGERAARAIQTKHFRTMALLKSKLGEELIDAAALVEGIKTQSIPSRSFDVNFEAVAKQFGELSWTTTRAVSRARKLLARIARR